MSDPYDLNEIPKRLDTVLAAEQEWLEHSLTCLYPRRCTHRRAFSIPALAILGHGRSGKDTAAEYLCQATGMTYVSSSSLLMRFVARFTDLPTTQAWTERHQHREFWIAAGHAVRRRQLDIFARLTLAHGDLAVGLRGRHEIYESQRCGTLDYLLWIDNPRVPVDVTMEVGASDCDFVIPNHGSYVELYRKLDNFIRLAKLPGNYSPPE